MGSLYSRRYDPVKMALAVARAVYEPEPMNRAFGDFLPSVDLRPELGRITAPTLVMAGRHDWICPPEFSEEIARLIPGAEMRVFENSSHTIRADEPQALIDAIAGFVVGTG
jgi:proline iminopeptidase